MSMLVIQLPARSRGGASAPQGSADYSHVLSADGMAAGTQGRAPASALPKADTVVAVLPATEIGWHRITLPRAPANRLRAALAEQLDPNKLDGVISMHLIESDPALSRPITDDPSAPNPGAGDWFVLIDATDVNAIPAAAGRITDNAAFLRAVAERCLRAAAALDGSHLDTNKTAAPAPA